MQAAIARKSMPGEQIGIALSGGVDSTVAALLLKDSCQLTGFFMQLAQPDLDLQQQRVTTIAHQLDIPLRCIDLRSQFEEKVLSYFASGYFAGTTPNPCVICNRDIKFGLFAETMLAAGMQKIATGHYARITKDSAGFHLQRGVDQRKDQAYFLAALNQQQLARMLLPLGSYHKAQIFELAARYGFHDFPGTESQDVCFLHDTLVGDYLAQRYPQHCRPGPVITSDGQEIGRHQGLFRHTVGQRRGLGIPDSSPWYVLSLDRASNALVVGKQSQLLSKTVHVHQLHWMLGQAADTSLPFLVRLRSSHNGALAKATLTSDDSALLLFDEPQRAVAPGQFAVLYRDQEVFASAVIVGTLP